MPIMNGGRLAFVAGSGIALFARGTDAHGGDMSKVQDGEAMSIEPIVRPSQSIGECLSDTNNCGYVGFDIMGSYPAANACLWHYLSDRNGSWSM